MNCPRCGEKTIDFFDWCKTRNALWWKCPHCNIRLKASRATWMLLGGALLVFIAIVFGMAIVEYARILPKEQSRTVLGALLFVAFIPYYWVAYQRGGYVSRDG
jgi:hypothetical protein